MTVSTQVSRNEYTGNGATTQYDFTFRILDKSHLLVQTLDTSESIVTLTLGTDYTVTGVNRYNGGKVVLTSALPAGYKISIERSTPVTQEASIRNQGGFFPEIHEDAFDKLTMLVQQAYGWWSGLSLRKPSWLANYYDALNNRIRNLRDPSQDQDAATKKYTDTLNAAAIGHSDDLFKRTMRVPESAISILPAKDFRKNKIVAMDNNGDPLMVLPESGSAADVLIELAKPTGGQLVKVQNATVTELTEASILMFMTRADINTLLNTTGAEVAVDYALQAIINAGYKSVRFPHTVKGIYTLNGSVILPGGFTIYGECSKPYTITDDSSFVGKGTVIRKASGADYIFGPGSVFRIYGCILDGRDQQRPLINQTNQVRGGILFNCGIYRFLYGIGSYSYTSIQVGKSSICANQDGVYNLIDSRVIDCTINTQTRHGVNLQAGANNNLFSNVRNEWNEGIGYNISGSIGNIINGELVDRNGSTSFAITNGGGAVIGDLLSQRPGRNSSAGSSYNTHFYIEGSGSYIMLSNVKTRVGADDDGGGNITPERVITTGGSSSNMSIQADNCDLTGYTISSLREITVSGTKLFGNNIGVNNIQTVGLYRFIAGRNVSGGTYQGSVLSSSVGATLTLTFDNLSMADPTTQQAGRPKRRTLLIESITNSGITSTYDISILIRRVVSNAAYDVMTGKEYSYPTNVIGRTGATGIGVSITINSDASVITVVLTNIDGAGRFIDAELISR
ncbi:phage tail fiber protein [Klebsiella pneumoniae]|uniref:phage tail fiber domain-containing protein n=1 Tax=Klebsiella pneumoniae TaxID=573 RepID=UPI00330F208A|nr:phage tail protein [Klebsiella pneumoniae]HDH0467824.1 phage tail protein [Klebsiella pneumoniae]